MPSYLKNRAIVLNSSETMVVEVGVPQRSIWSPMLRNGVLDLKPTVLAVSVAFAEDLALFTEARNGDSLVRNTNEYLSRTNE